MPNDFGIRGQLQIVRNELPWSVDPRPHVFVLPEDDGYLCGVVLVAGTHVNSMGAIRLGTGGTRTVAACLAGTEDIIVVGSRVRYEISDRRHLDRKLFEICAAHDSEMKRNGTRLLEVIDVAVRWAIDNGCMKRLRAVVRYFPEVALRHPRVSVVLDTHGQPGKSIRRWLGQSDGQGRPGRQISAARTKIGTLVHECAVGDKIGETLKNLERAGLGCREGLANLRSDEGLLYELSVAGVWVKPAYLQEMPWVDPEAAQKRWDVYRLPA